MNRSTTASTSGTRCSRISRASALMTVVSREHPRRTARHSRGRAAHAARLLEREPAAAAEQAAEILKVVPDQPQALALSGLALGPPRQGRRGHRRAAPRGASQARTRPKPGARWPITTGARNARGGRRGLRAASRHSTRDPRLMAAALALTENRIPGRGSAAARTPQAASHRRGRDPHAGRSRGAHRALRRCRDAAGALPRARARVSHAARQNYAHGAAPAEQAERGARAK